MSKLITHIIDENITEKS